MIDWIISIYQKQIYEIYLVCIGVPTDLLLGHIAILDGHFQTVNLDKYKSQKLPNEGVF